MPTFQGDESWDVNPLAHVWFRLKGLPLFSFPLQPHQHIEERFLTMGLRLSKLNA